MTKNVYYIRSFTVLLFGYVMLFLFSVYLVYFYEGSEGWES